MNYSYMFSQIIFQPFIQSFYLLLRVFTSIMIILNTLLPFILIFFKIEKSLSSFKVSFLQLHHFFLLFLSHLFLLSFPHPLLLSKALARKDHQHLHFHFAN